MNPTITLVAAVNTALLPLADPERAAGMQAYMRNQFRFLGIPTPLRRQATRPLMRQKRDGAGWLAVAEALWIEPEREFQYVAVDMLIRQHATLSPADIPALLALAQRHAWWDTVDGLAGVVGDILKRARADDPGTQRSMDAALQHPDKWVRRIALLHQLGWKGETDTARLFGYALAQAAEPDFFIRKAIGWALRDYARHDPDAVRAFLAGAGAGLSPLSRREAGKHLGCKHLGD